MHHGIVVAGETGQQDELPDGREIDAAKWTGSIKFRALLPVPMQWLATYRHFLRIAFVSVEAGRKDVRCSRGNGPFKALNKSIAMSLTTLLRRDSKHLAQYLGGMRNYAVLPSKRRAPIQKQRLAKAPKLPENASEAEINEWRLRVQQEQLRMVEMEAARGNRRRVDVHAITVPLLGSCPSFCAAISHTQQGIRQPSTSPRGRFHFYFLDS